MKTFNIVISLFFIIALLLSACDSGYRKAKVIKMAAIWAPPNLADDDECEVLYSNITRYGIEMDEGRDDWNQVILTSIYQLIEKGCVKVKSSER
ncbi:MAG: hypothetical protein HY609_04925 [Deltaproteobacteria bacterium]|nr:hypothetical protein [Deltaproteobacteria bacterium]MBI4224255.1 hypothetical protein [Deltaproteobacteria bacterium]